MFNYKLLMEGKISAKNRADSEGKVWETLVGRHLNNDVFPADHREKGKSPEQVHNTHATSLFGRKYRSNKNYIRMNDAAKEAANEISSKVGETNRVALASQKKDHEKETGVEDPLSKADLIVTKSNGGKQKAISLKHGRADRATNYSNPGVDRLESHAGIIIKPHQNAHYNYMKNHGVANLTPDEYKVHPQKELIDASNDNMMRNIARDYAHGLANKLHHPDQNTQDENLKNHIRRTIGGMGYVEGGDEAKGKTHLQHFIVKSLKDKDGNYTHSVMDSEEHANNYLSYFHNLHVETSPHEDGKKGKKSVAIYGTHKGTGKIMRIHEQSLYSSGGNQTLGVRGATRLSSEHKVDATKPFNSSTVSEARETPLQRAKRSPDAGVQPPKLLDRVKSKLKDKLGIKEESLDEKCWDGYKRVPGTKKNAPGSCEKIKEEKDACYHKVKSRYRVWPSAYASGALSKCRKVGAKNWGTQKEETKITGTNCANCIWWKKHSEKPVDKSELNENGGLKPTSEAYIKMAKHVDLVSLPGKATVKVKAFCAHEDVQDFVTERMCCAYWDNKDAERDFKGKADVMDENVKPIVSEDLRKWFREKWVRFGPDGKVRGDCARGSKSEGKPKCLPAADAAALGKEGRAKAARRKRREDSNPNRRGKAIMVKTKIGEAFDSEEGKKTLERYKTKASNVQRALPSLQREFKRKIEKAEELAAQHSPGGKLPRGVGRNPSIAAKAREEAAKAKKSLEVFNRWDANRTKGLKRAENRLNEASDLHCPECGTNHGKDRENPQDKTCNQCGHKFKNIYGFKSETDNDAEAAAWLKKFNESVNDFKVGDQVVIHSPDDLDWHERKGELISTSDDGHVVKLNDGTKLAAAKHQVKKVENENIGEDLESHWKARAAKFYSAGEKSQASGDNPTAARQFTAATRVRNKLISRSMAATRKNLDDIRRMRSGQN